MSGPHEDDSAVPRARDKPAKKRCEARTKSGKPCQRIAGAGTDHPGHGRCSKHSGSTPTGKIVAAREQVTAMAAAMGAGVDADPFETIMLAIRQARAEVILFGELAAQHDQPFTAGPFGDVLHPAVKERQLAMDRAVSYAKTAIALGISERQVRVAEQVGTRLGEGLLAFVEALGLSGKQRKLVPGAIDALLLDMSR